MISAKSNGWLTSAAARAACCVRSFRPFRSCRAWSSTFRACIEDARRCLVEAGLTDRAEAVAGNFFEGVPSGADAYVLSWILHDWDDESALRILANCRAAIGNAGRLLVIEMVLPSADEPRSPRASYLEQLAKVTDLEMLAVVGGRERTRAEYGELLSRAGFGLTQVLDLESMPWSVIEATPV